MTLLLVDSPSLCVFSSSCYYKPLHTCAVVWFIRDVEQYPIFALSTVVGSRPALRQITQYHQTCNEGTCMTRVVMQLCMAVFWPSALFALFRRP